MGDLLFLIIIVGAILMSAIEQLAKRKKNKDGPSLDERLEEAIRRSKEMARGRDERPKPTVRTAPKDRGASLPTAQPPPTRPIPRRASPSPARPAEALRPSAPRPSPRVEPVIPEPAPVFVQSQVQRLQTTKSYEEGARPTRIAGTGLGSLKEPAASRRRSAFSQRQLRDLIVFGEALQRPRWLREHPIYHRSSRI
jgi:hypothetical protein